MSKEVKETTEVATSLSAELKQLKENLVPKEKSEIQGALDQSLSDLESDDSTESNQKPRKKRKSSCLETNMNLQNVKKHKIDDNNAMVNENLHRFTAKENLSAKLAQFNEWIPTTPMSFIPNVQYYRFDWINVIECYPSHCYPMLRDKRPHIGNTFSLPL
jgi:hypothetical protein